MKIQWAGVGNLTGPGHDGVKDVSRIPGTDANGIVTPVWPCQRAEVAEEQDLETS
jgi:hypothetical protein